jgi:hypothetical protein
MNVILNVQGQTFETDYDTLTKIPYFKNMFEDCGQPTEPVFVNRSSHMFKHVLAIITDDTYQYPGKYKSELDFYGIDYSKLTLYFRPQVNICKHPECNTICDVSKSLCKEHKFCHEVNCNTTISTLFNYCNSCVPKSNYCNIGGCNRLKMPNNPICYQCRYSN